MSDFLTIDVPNEIQLVIRHERHYQRNINTFEIHMHIA
jgi:hypothetical protein